MMTLDEIDNQLAILWDAREAMRTGTGPDVDHKIRAAMDAEQRNYPAALLALKAAMEREAMLSNVVRECLDIIGHKRDAGQRLDSVYYTLSSAEIAIRAAHAKADKTQEKPNG